MEWKIWKKKTNYSSKTKVAREVVVADQDPDRIKEDRQNAWDDKEEVIIIIITIIFFIIVTNIFFIILAIIVFIIVAIIIIVGITINNVATPWPRNPNLQDLDRMLKNLKGHMTQLQHGGRKRKNVNYEVKKISKIHKFTRSIILGNTSRFGQAEETWKDVEVQG